MLQAVILGSASSTMFQLQKHMNSSLVAMLSRYEDRLCLDKTSMARWK